MTFTYAIPEYVLAQYQSAAVGACYELMIDPYAIGVNGSPAWVVVAQEMHKMNVLRKHMVMSGLSMV